MHIDIKWEECRDATSQLRTQDFISCLERIYDGVPGKVDVHPIGEYAIVHLPRGYRTHGYDELFTTCNVTPRKHN